MAKIKFGMMMTDARGKLGGQVFSKNRSGAYVRTKVTPVNPRTPFQQQNRSLLGSLSSAWSALTQDQRLAWNNAVENWQKTNVFGDLQKPTGKNLFTGLNKNMVSHFPGNAVQTLPPAKTEFPAFSIVSAVWNTASTGFVVTLNESFGTAVVFRVRSTPPMSLGTTYFDNQLRTIGETFNTGVGTTLTLTTAYVARFGDLTPGFVVGIEVTPISETGQLGVPANWLVITA